MTPEEEQMMLVQILRRTQGPVRPPITMESQVNQQLAQPIPPGMISQSADAGKAQADIDAMSQDISGAERAAGAQRAFAQQLRGRAAPQGKTVGPSGLYVGPNWGESLEFATNQLAAGYMGRKANEKDAALDEQRTAKLRAEIAQAQANKDRTFGQGDRRLDLTLRGQNIGVDQFGVTSGQGQQRIDNQADQFGKTLGQRGSHFQQTLAQNQQKLDELVYQGTLKQGNEERKMALDEGESTPYLLDGEVRHIRKAYIDGVQQDVDENNIPIDMRNAMPIYKPSSTSGRSATPKYPKTFYGANGELQETVMVGTDRINVGGENDGKKYVKPKGAKEALSADKLATELGKFDKRTEGVRDLAMKFNAANEVLANYEIDIFGGDNALEPFQNMSGFMGGMIRTGSDLYNENQQAGEIFSAMNDVIAQIVREQAGLSQTAKEIETISNTYGRNWYDNPQILVKAWPRLQRLIADDMKSKVGSTHGHVLSEYRGNLASEGSVDWTKIGVGLEGDMPPSWIDDVDAATAADKKKVDARGRPVPVAIPADVQKLDDEEEELYKQFPNLRPK